MNLEAKQVRAHIVAAMGELAKHYDVTVNIETSCRESRTDNEWYAFFFSRTGEPRKCRLCGHVGGKPEDISAATSAELMEKADKQFAGVTP